jgi:hypothetical protein
VMESALEGVKRRWDVEVEVGLEMQQLQGWSDLCRSQEH